MFKLNNASSSKAFTAWRLGLTQQSGLCRPLKRSWVHISARRRASWPKFLRRFPQSLQVNYCSTPYMRTRPLPFIFSSINQPLYHSMPQSKLPVTSLNKQLRIIRCVKLRTHLRMQTTLFHLQAERAVARKALNIPHYHETTFCWHKNVLHELPTLRNIPGSKIINTVRVKLFLLLKASISPCRCMGEWRYSSAHS